MAELPQLDESVNWCSLLEKQVVRYFRRLKTVMPFGPVILLLGIYPKEVFGNVCSKDFAQLGMLYRVI